MRKRPHHGVADLFRSRQPADLETAAARIAQTIVSTRGFAAEQSPSLCRRMQVYASYRCMCAFLRRDSHCGDRLSMDRDGPAKFFLWAVSAL